LYIRLQLQLKFIIHFLPVSSGFRMDTRAFRSLLRVVYALPTAQGTYSTNAQLSSAISRMTLGANVVCYITDDSWRKCRLLDHGYNAIEMTPGPAAMLCPGFCTGSRQKRSKRSKRVKYCGSIRTLRSLPDDGRDVCEVWFRSVQKYGFV